MIQAITSDQIIEKSDAFALTDAFRRDINRRLPKKHRSLYGQFLTPSPIARIMADMFVINSNTIHLLDPGAGVGALLAAFVQRVCAQKSTLTRLEITAYEIDSTLVEYLQETLRFCEELCKQAHIEFSYRIIQEDFIAQGVKLVSGLSDQSELFSPSSVPRFDFVIMNPPYKKIKSSSMTRKCLSSQGMETTNMYTAFLWLAFRLLRANGQLVAITPRSFCNGPYFLPFREAFSKEMAFRQIHIFNNRNAIFGDDDVLQENIIFHARKTFSHDKPVAITSSDGFDVKSQTVLDVPHAAVLNPSDPQLFINIIPDKSTQGLTSRMNRFTCTLDALGIQVSTGRVVDFRSKQHLRPMPEPMSVPLIYPMHFSRGFVAWPNPGSKKPNAIDLNADTKDLLVATSFYTLCKRFTAKEEPRRLVAAVFDPACCTDKKIGFENHLNYFHENGTGLSENISKGLSLYLNSTLLDLYFRQFSGHTQVNATDLRSLRYPSREDLDSLGAMVPTGWPSQEEIDKLIEERFFNDGQKRKAC